MQQLEAESTVIFLRYITVLSHHPGAFDVHWVRQPRSPHTISVKLMPPGLRHTMYLLIYLSTLFGSLFAHKPDASAGPPLFLNVTTIAARDCHSILECWQLDSPFKVPSTPGVAGASAASLGPAGGNLSYTILPPHFDGGLHTAPMVQYVRPSWPPRPHPQSA